MKIIPGSYKNTYSLFLESKNKTFILILLVFASIFEVSGIALVYPLVAKFFNLTVEKNIFFEKLTSVQNYYDLKNEKVFFIFLLISLLIFKSIFLTYFRILLVRNSFDIIIKFRKKIFKNFFLAKYGYLQEKLSAALNFFTYQSETVGSAVTNQFNIISNLIGIFFLFLLFAIFSFKIFLISFFLIIVSAFLFKFLITYVKIISTQLLISQQKYYLIINETLKNYQYLKISNSYSRLYFKFVKLLIDIKKNNIFFVFINRGTQSLSEPIVAFLIILTFYVAIDYLNFDIALAGVLFIICLRLYSHVLKLFDNIQSYKKDLVSYDHLNLFLSDIINNSEEEHGKNDFILYDKITVENLTFLQKERIIFKNLSFIINKNSLTLIKGRSGTGKTTLLNCLSGLLKINNGIIKYDKININQINRNSLAVNTGYVLQENFFFNGSVIDNLKFNNKYIDLSKIYHFAKTLNLKEIIDKNIIINEAASNLSVGEKQRLALIRELIRKPKLLILDEVTSSIDQNSIDVIVNYLKVLKKDITIIVVAHKNDFDEIADNIIQL
jgi:ABC-type bacteriocin/lantibiotic exporter with double-glycine peptidase domain